MNKSFGFFEVLLAGILAMMLYNYIERPLELINKLRPYNAQWQNHQNAKMVKCYQKMPTQLAVNECLIKLGVFI